MQSDGLVVSLGTLRGEGGVVVLYGFHGVGDVLEGVKPREGSVDVHVVGWSVKSSPMIDLDLASSRNMSRTVLRSQRCLVDQRDIETTRCGAKVEFCFCGGSEVGIIYVI